MLFMFLNFEVPNGFQLKKTTSFILDIEKLFAYEIKKLPIPLL